MQLFNVIKHKDIVDYWLINVSAIKHKASTFDGNYVHACLSWDVITNEFEPLHYGKIEYIMEATDSFERKKNNIYINIATNGIENSVTVKTLENLAASVELIKCYKSKYDKGI